MSTPRNPIFCALDTADVGKALAWAKAVQPFVGGLKIGLEFFNSTGPQGVAKIVEVGLPVFADLKLHDIPNTVAGGIRAVLPLGLAIINVHASGGAAMMRAAAEAARASGANGPKVVGVTVLTSLDAGDLAATGITGAPPEQVIRLAKLAQSSGLDGVVCSAHEIAPLRVALRESFMLVVPGIAAVHLAATSSGLVINRIDLVTRAKVPGLDAAKFAELAKTAKDGCPVSKALASVDVHLDATLES